VSIPGSEFEVCDTVNIMVGLADYRDGDYSAANGTTPVEGLLVETGDALLFKLPSVPMYMVDRVADLHSFNSAGTDKNVVMEHAAKGTALLDGKHYKWVKYNLPNGVVCTTDHFGNRSNGKLKMRFIMTPQGMPDSLRAPNGDAVISWNFYSEWWVTIDKTTQALVPNRDSKMTQLGEAFNHVLRMSEQNRRNSTPGPGPDNMTS
jgi:hypothetical protein